MNKHKTKFFKKTFESNVDCHMGFEPSITETTFVPLIGQLYDQAKTRYKKRYKQKALEFGTWLGFSFIYSIERGKWIYDVDDPKGSHNWKTTEELYELWKNRK